MTIDNHVFQEYTETLFKTYLGDNSVKEICINPDGNVWIEKTDSVWSKVDQIDNDIKKVSTDLQQFVKTCANHHRTNVSETNPFLSGTLITGERVQIVYPPASKQIAIAIRKNSKENIPYLTYEKQGLFNDIKPYGYKSERDKNLEELYRNKQYSEFIKQAVTAGKNLIICGETGSGKTTLMKSLIEFIPQESRLISIEDTEEITYFHHENYLQLFYDAQYKEKDPVTPSSLLRACLRLKPDRILLAEVRDKVALDFLKVMTSGHNGTMTSAHTPNVELTFEKLLSNVMENPLSQGLSDKTIKSMLGSTIDIIIHISAFEGSRRITETYYKGMDYEKIFN